MNPLQLKNNILKEISQIDDIDSLKKINDLINSFYKNTGFKSDKIATSSNKKTGLIKDKENFTDYIKEWIKDM